MAKKSNGAAAAKWLRSVADILERKAASYGDSIGNPVRVFYKGSASDGLRARCDDKLARIARGKGWPGDDNYKDAVGYIALLAVTKE